MFVSNFLLILVLLPYLAYLTLYIRIMGNHFTFNTNQYSKTLNPSFNPFKSFNDYNLIPEENSLIQCNKQVNLILTKYCYISQSIEKQNQKRNYQLHTMTQTYITIGLIGITQMKYGKNG